MKNYENFAVTGKLHGDTEFSIEIKAKSEKHARSVAISMLGSKHGLKKNRIDINEIKKVR
jgi:ribosomal protein L20A (L18A)